MGEIVVGAACKIAENDGRTLMDSTASDAITKIGEKASAKQCLLFPIRMGVAIYNNFGIAARTKIIYLYLRIFSIYRSLSYTLPFTPESGISLLEILKLLKIFGILSLSL